MKVSNFSKKRDHFEVSKVNHLVKLPFITLSNYTMSHPCNSYRINFSCNIVLGNNRDKVSQLSIDQLLSIITNQGLPLDENLLESVARDSYSLFDFMDKYEEKTGRSIPNKFSDNFLTIIGILWERLYPEIYSIDLILSRHFRFMKSEKSPNLVKAQFDYFHKIIQYIKSEQLPEFTEEFFRDAEVIAWISEFTAQRSLLKDHDLAIKDLQGVLSVLSELNLDLHGHGTAMYYTKWSLAETYAISGSHDRARELFEQLAQSDHRTTKLYISWLEHDPNYEIINSQDKNEDILPELQYFEGLLQQAVELAEQNMEQENLLRFYEDLHSLYIDWKPDELGRLVDNIDQLRIDLQQEVGSSQTFNEDPDLADFDLSMFQENLLFDIDKSLPIDLICYECGLGFYKQVDTVLLFKTYINSHHFLSNTSKLENGWIGFNREIRCPHCESYKFIVAMRTKFRMAINASHQENLPRDNWRIIPLEDISGKPSVTSVREVIKYWQKEAKRFPDKTKPFTNAGRFLMMYNHYDLAKKYLLKAVKLDRDNEYGLFLLGKIYFERENYKLARSCFKKVMERNPSLIKRVKNETTPELRRFYMDKVAK